MQCLLNCLVYKTEAARASKQYGKTEQREGWSHAQKLSYKLAMQALGFFNKRTPQDKQQDLLVQHSIITITTVHAIILISLVIMRFIRSQKQAELHKTTSTMQESITNQVFYRQAMFSVKSSGVEEKCYIAQKAFETGHMHWFSTHTKF